MHWSSWLISLPGVWSSYLITLLDKVGVGKAWPFVPASVLLSTSAQFLPCGNSSACTEMSERYKVGGRGGGSSQGISGPSSTDPVQRFAKLSLVWPSSGCGKKRLVISPGVLMSSPHAGPTLSSSARVDHHARNRIAGIPGGTLCFISSLLWPMFCRKLQVHGNEISGCEVTRIR